MSQTRKLWLGLTALLLATFSVLLWMGGEIHRQQPPMPVSVVSADGAMVYTRTDIKPPKQRTISRVVEYGPYIPTLCRLLEDGHFE